MEIVVNGAKVFAGTGGRPFNPKLPLALFLHGAGMDHTVWALLARWFAHHGCCVLAPDLPGHGQSAGEPLASIAALGLIATAAAMRVSPDLLHAAQANDHAAIDMVAIWGHGFHASLGGSLAPGAWMLGSGVRLLERTAPGVLFKDLAACNAYESA